MPGLRALSFLCLLTQIVAGDVTRNAKAVDGSTQSATTRLFNTLLVTFAAVFLGYMCVRLKLIAPQKGEMKGFGFFIGQIVFPLLIFKTVATSRLDGISLSTLLACSLGKIVIMVITFFSTLLFYKARRPAGERFLSATVFASFVISSNDFAVGFPVVQALYGQEHDMGILITGNALVGSTIFVPLVMVLFSIGEALQKRGQSSDTVESREAEGAGCGCLMVIRDILLNPIITMTLAGSLYKVIFGWTLREDGTTLEMPHPLSDILDLLTGPFSSCALFLTGTSLKTFKISLVPIILVIMKVVVCAYVSYAIAGRFVQVSGLPGFSFLYGMIPTSSAPLIFAMRFAPGSAELVATSVLMGLVVAGPLMFVAALFLEAERISMVDTLIAVQITTTITALICGAAFLIMMTVLRKAWSYSDPQKLLLLGYGMVLIAYQVLMVLVNPLFKGDACLAYNAEHGWTAMSISVGWLQNASRLMLMSVQLLHVTGSSEPQTGMGRRGAALFAMSLALGVLPSLVTFPNTLNEVCSTVEPPLGKISLVPNAVWNFLLLVVTVILAVYGFARRRRLRSSDQALTTGLEPSSTSLAQAPAKMLTRSGAAQTCGLPRSMMQYLLASAILRFFMQNVNTSLVWLGGVVKGAFAEMLVIENVLEHGQLVVLLVILLTDQSFSAHLGKLLHPWSKNPETRQRRSSTRLTMFPEQACMVFAEQHDQESDLEHGEMMEPALPVSGCSNESEGDSGRTTGDDKEPSLASADGSMEDADGEKLASMEARLP